ncbi:hypothetical protein LJC68_10325 [Bacteroidales bacterium OttesenSCG-928-B11]|nr:hypothetical protein [Bacteroidales bacterium OttesenSCG-928-B11]
MKKKLVILFFIGISISIFVGCFSTEHNLIKDFEFFGIELTNPNEIEDKNFVSVHDTLRNKLYFRILAHGEYQYGYLNNRSLINQCYATSVPQVLDNTILLDELELRLNSDIYFESEIIEKGTDLWNHPKLKEYKWFSETVKYGITFYGDIGFTGVFYDKVSIPRKDYTVEMTCKTSDNQIITKSIELYLKL